MSLSQEDEEILFKFLDSYYASGVHRMSGYGVPLPNPKTSKSLVGSIVNMVGAQVKFPDGTIKNPLDSCSNSEYPIGYVYAPGDVEGPSKFLPSPIIEYKFGVDKPKIWRQNVKESAIKWCLERHNIPYTK